MNRKILIGGIAGVIALFLVLLVVASVLGGNKKKAIKLTNDNVTLTYWGVDDTSETLDPFIQDYQKLHGNIKIDYKKLDRATYESQLVDALASGKGPDLFEVHNDWLPRYYDKITSMPTDIYSPDDYKREFFPVVTDETIAGGKIYGVPLYLDTLGLYSNNRLLDNASVTDPPKTWEDLVKKGGVLTQLTNRQGRTINQSAIALGNTKISRASDVLALLMLQQRTQMTNDTRSAATFNLPQKVQGKDVYLGTQALDFFTSFANPAKSNYTWDDSLGDSVTAFAKGKVAMIIGYPYVKAQLTKLSPNLQFTIAGVPQIGGQDPVNFASFWPNVVSKSSQHQREAWDFIKYLSSKDQLPTYLDSAQRVSPRKDIPGAGNFDAFYQQNASAVTWYKGDAAKADGIFIELIGRVLSGENLQRSIDAAANEETQVLTDVKQHYGPPQ